MKEMSWTSAISEKGSLESCGNLLFLNALKDEFIKNMQIVSSSVHLSKLNANVKYELL